MQLFNQRKPFRAGFFIRNLFFLIKKWLKMSKNTENSIEDGRTQISENKAETKNEITTMPNSKENNR